MKCSMLTWPIHSIFVEFYTKFLLSNSIGIKLDVGTYLKDTFNIALCSDASELISLELGMMIDTT